MTQTKVSLSGQKLPSRHRVATSEDQPDASEKPAPAAEAAATASNQSKPKPPAANSDAREKVKQMLAAKLKERQALQISADPDAADTLDRSEQANKLSNRMKRQKTSSQYSPTREEPTSHAQYSPTATAAAGTQPSAAAASGYASAIGGYSTMQNASGRPGTHQEQTAMLQQPDPAAPSTAAAGNVYDVNYDDVQSPEYEVNYDDIESPPYVPTEPTVKYTLPGELKSDQGRDGASAGGGGSLKAKQASGTDANSAHPMSEPGHAGDSSPGNDSDTVPAGRASSSSYDGNLGKDQHGHHTYGGVDSNRPAGRLSARGSSEDAGDDDFRVSARDYHSSEYGRDQDEGYSDDRAEFNNNNRRR